MVEEREPGSIYVNMLHICGFRIYKVWITFFYIFFKTSRVHANKLFFFFYFFSIMNGDYFSPQQRVGFDIQSLESLPDFGLVTRAPLA